MKEISKENSSNLREIIKENMKKKWSISKKSPLSNSKHVKIGTLAMKDPEVW